MRSEKARVGVFLHLVYIFAAIFYCIHLLNTSTIANGQPQVMSAVSYYDESTKLLNQEELNIYRLINEKRRANGIAELKVEPRLVEVAKARAKDMSVLGYYAHQSPDGKYYYDLLDTDYNNVFSCENLELEFSQDSHLFIDRWMNSGKHRNCMLAPNTSDIGLAVAEIQLGSSSTVSKAYIVVNINSATPNK